MRASSSPTILLINFHSASNSGDAALLSAAVAQLRAAFDHPRLIVSANYPQEAYLTELQLEVVPSPAALVHAHRQPFVQILALASGLLRSWISASRTPSQGDARLPQAGWQRMLAAYRQASLVVGCPGNQFFSMGRFGWPLLVSAMAVYLAHLFRKPLYVMPQSLGPFKRRWEAWLMRRLYGKARLVFLREPLSYRLAVEIGIPASILRTAPDPAFQSPRESNPAARHLLDRLGGSQDRPLVGVTVIKRMVQTLDAAHIDAYYRAMALLLERIVREYGAKVCFFPQVTGPAQAEDDRIAARQVAELMHVDRNDLLLVEDPLPLDTLKSLYGCMQVFIAGRLHSGIFALSASTPTLFVGYLTKTRGVLQDLGLQDWLVEIGDLDQQRLWEKFERLWSQRQQIRAGLERGIPLIAARAAQTGASIAEDFNRGS